MNSTTRSLLFWMVLVVVVALIWNVSSQFRNGDNALDFSEFIRWVDSGQVESVMLTGNEITGTATSEETGAVAGGPLEDKTKPSITGQTLEGATLTADPGTWVIRTRRRSAPNISAVDSDTGPMRSSPSVSKLVSNNTE